MPSTVLLVTAILIVTVAVKYWQSLSAPLPGIPCNKHNTWNLFGDIFELVNTDTPVDYFSQIVQKHGNLCQILLGPLGRLVLVADAREIEENLLKRSHLFDKASAVRAAFSGTVPLGSVGLPAHEQWKLHRRMMQPSMSPAYLAVKMNNIFTNARKMLKIWQLKSILATDAKGVFQCDDDIEKFAMDTIIDVLFGENLKALDLSYQYLSQLVTSQVHDPSALDSSPISPEYNSFRVLLKSMGIALRSGAARATYLRLNLTPTWHFAQRNARQFVEKKVKEHERDIKVRTRKHEDSFLDTLFSRSPTGRPDGVSLAALKDELITYIIGGADTSATVISWIIQYLLHNPRVQIRLHEELSATLHMSDEFTMTYDEVQGSSFPYLEAVISETLRLANVGGVSARDALEDVVISGCRIPKGTQVFFLTGHVGIFHAPPVDGFPEADYRTFCPERWLEKHENDKDVYNPRRNTVWPFGHGPRGCPGQRLAILEIKAILIMISLSFFLQKVGATEESRAEMLVVLRKPAQAFLKLQSWEEADVKSV